MNDPEPVRDDEIDGLVRRYLDRSADRVDPRPAFDRLRQALDWDTDSAQLEATHVGARVASPSVRRLWFWGISAAAAAVVLSALLLVEPRPALARADTLVREAKQAHLQPLDRCYLVEFRRDSALVDECSPLTSQVRQTRLWTRGDRFWVESVQPDKRWAWGRDERNRFWFALGPHRGIRLEPDEMSPWLNLCCDLYCIRLEQLLGEMLSDFDLTREDAGTRSAPATQVVRATPRAGTYHPNLKSLVLEIDAETRVVRGMVLERMKQGKPFATVTYTLVETRTLDDAKFQLEGHLDPKAPVFTQDFEPTRRRKWLTFCFGPRASAMFRLRGDERE